MHYNYPVQISGFWEQLGQYRNQIVKNIPISGHSEPDIQYFPNKLCIAVLCATCTGFLFPIHIMSFPFVLYPLMAAGKPVTNIACRLCRQ